MAALAPKKTVAPPKPPAPPAAKPVSPAPKPAAAPKPPVAPVVRTAAGQPTSRKGNTPTAPTAPKTNPVVKGPSGAPAKPAQYQRYTDPSGAKFQFVSGSWKKTAAAPAAGSGGAGGAGSAASGGAAAGADAAVDTGVTAGVEPPVSAKTPEQIAADVSKAAQSEVSMRDPALEGRWTSETKGLGGLGFGYTKAGGAAATYNDIFGSLAPGTSVDRNAFEVRDALGRTINRDILGTDVYGGAAATDIAGTALGNEILGARRSAASEAEGRSSSGVSGGGIRNAAGEMQTQREGAAITGLLGKLYGLEGDITSARTKTYQDALETAASGDVGRWAPEPAATTTSAATTPSSTTAGGKTTLTTGPKGTFMQQTNAARASGTPAQKIQKLNALLSNPKYNMSALQKKTIKQMITDIQKKKK